MNDWRLPMRNCPKCESQEHLQAPQPCPHCGLPGNYPPGKEPPVVIKSR